MRDRPCVAGGPAIGHRNAIPTEFLLAVLVDCTSCSSFARSAVFRERMTRAHTSFMAWFGRRKRAAPTSGSVSEAAEPRHALDRLSQSTDQAAFGGRYFYIVEAIAWWRAQLPDGQIVLADAATRALVAGADGSALAELAGVPRTENPFVVDALTDRVADELALHEALRGSAREIAVRRMCRAFLAAEMRERELSQWVHTEFHHESDSDLLNLLAELDDEYDEAEFMRAGPGDVERRIRQVAERILEQGRGAAH